MVDMEKFYDDLMINNLYLLLIFQPMTAQLCSRDSKGMQSLVERLVECKLFCFMVQSYNIKKLEVLEVVLTKNPLQTGSFKSFKMVKHYTR